MRSFPFPDIIASREEITRDLLYRKIPQEVCDVISDKAWDTGAEAAKAVLQEYPNKSIVEIAKLSGLSIERVRKDNVAGNVRYFSEYYSGRKKIVLYMESISKWAKANGCSIKEAVTLILSHEYFHFLECTKLGLTSRQYTVPSIKIGKYSFGKLGIRALSEIGAHGFSRTYYELKQPPTEVVSNSSTPLINHAVNAVEFGGHIAAKKIFSFNFLKRN